MSNFNISPLFGGNNQNNIFSSFNYSDYSLIKSGSYKKMMKAYYNDQKPSSTEKAQTAASRTKEFTSKISADDKSLSKVKGEADSLKAAAKELSSADLWKQTDGKYDSEKITGKVKDFVKEYNDLIDQTGKSNSQGVKNNTKWMTDLTSVMSKSLAKVGITVGDDNKLSVDEDKLAKADMKAVKSLFDGIYSYGAQTADKASAIASAASLNNGLYGSNGNYYNSYSNLFDTGI